MIVGCDKGRIVFMSCIKNCLNSYIYHLKTKFNYCIVMQCFYFNNLQNLLLKLIGFSSIFYAL